MASPPVMPDFTLERYRFHHTADSALDSLRAIGIDSRQITVRVLGRGWKPNAVVRQQPAAGSHLRPSTEIVLWVEGPSIFDALPLGMRDSFGDHGPSTQEIVTLLDDPMQKFRHALERAAVWFELREGDIPACRRFIKLFGIDAESWPPSMWFSLATLLPALHRTAGSEVGIRRVLKLLLNLEVYRFGWRRRSVVMRGEECTRLGDQFSRLGFDSVVGWCHDDFDCLVLVLGPVTLDVFWEYQDQEKQLLLDQVMNLVLPFTIATAGESLKILWQVGDGHRMPRLGVVDANSVLGVNAHLGSLMEV